jgi:hypothetical protein
MTMRRHSLVYELILMTGCAISGSETRTKAKELPTNGRMECVGKDNDLGFTAVSLSDLIFRPADFDTCEVLVHGFLGIGDSANGRLYLSREDLVAGGSLFGYVQVIFIPNGGDVPLDRLSGANRKLVSLKGRFENRKSGRTIVMVRELNLDLGAPIPPL